MLFDNYTFYDKVPEEFEHFIATTLHDLTKRDNNYIALNNLIKEEFKKFPNVEEMIYGESEGVALSKEEAISLKKVLDYEERKRIIEEKTIFFRGYKECYNLINKLDKIND